MILWNFKLNCLVNRGSPFEEIQGLSQSLRKGGRVWARMLYWLKVHTEQPTNASVPVDDGSQVCVNSTSKLQSWSATKEDLDHQYWSHWRWVLLVVMWVLQESCSLCGSVWLSSVYSMCLWAYWEYALSLTPGCTWDMVLTASCQSQWDRMIPLVFHSIKLGSSGWGRSIRLAPQLHWSQDALAALIFNLKTLKNVAQ